MKKITQKQQRLGKETSTRELTDKQLDQVIGGSALGPRGIDLALAISEGTKA